MMRPLTVGKPYHRCLAVHLHFAENQGALPRIEKRSAARWLVPIIPCLGLVALVIEWARYLWH